MRSMLYAFDGTWNDDANPDKWTNVYRMTTCLHRESARYYPGVGSWSDTGGSWLGRILGGAFAYGLSDIVRGAIQDWQRDVAAGVTVIDIIGFSRGSMAAIDFAGKIREYERDHKIPAKQRVTLRFLGLFDTVDAIGLPDVDWDPFYYKGPPTGKEGFQHAVHAVALHETRSTFQVRNVPDITKTMGFIGNHCDIGGGYRQRGLSDYSLRWMLAEGRKAGIRWQRSDRHLQCKPDDRQLPHRVAVSMYAHHPRTWPTGLTVFDGYPSFKKQSWNPAACELPHYPILRAVTAAPRRQIRDKRPIPQVNVVQTWEFINDQFTPD